MAYFERRDVAPALPTSPTAYGLYSAVLKRGVDLLAVVLLIVPVLVLILIVAPLIALDGRSPFYLQKRVGRYGREFNIVKLRSMVPNASELLEKHLAENPAARREWDEKQKLKHDPRVTKMGMLIRKTSLDELPQLWNVLVGDMSMVGPRPMMPCQKEIYPGTAYYEMRPGITGLWQVSERNETSFAQRAFYDNQYHHDLSLRSDLEIMLRTARVVVAATGH